LGFLFKQRRHRARAVYLALAAGWAMGGYKMLIGDHFLSHTIISMLLAWLLVNTVVIAERRTFGRPCSSTASASDDHSEPHYRGAANTCAQ
jgi:membrane-associated PAP2 superfamily phosphatase